MASTGTATSLISCHIPGCTTAFSTQGNLKRHLMDQHAELRFWYKMPCNKVLKYNVFNGKRHMDTCLPCQKVQPPAAMSSEQTLLLSTDEPFQANAEEMFSFNIEQMPWLKTNEALSFNMGEPLPINTNEPLPFNIGEPLPININEPLPFNIVEPLSFNIVEPLSFNISEPLPFNINEPLPINIEEMVSLIFDGAPWKPKVFVAHSRLTKNDIEHILR